jgi:hypothetical protein
MSVKWRTHLRNLPLATLYLKIVGGYALLSVEHSAAVVHVLTEAEETRSSRDHQAALGLRQRSGCHENPLCEGDRSPSRRG